MCIIETETKKEKEAKRKGRSFPSLLFFPPFRNDLVKLNFLIVGKMQSEQKKENCRTPENLETSEISETPKTSNLPETSLPEIELPDKICKTSCRICQSEHLKEIHSLRKNGLKFSEIVDIIGKKYNEKISSPSLSRHFKNYERIVKISTAKVLDDDLVDDVMKRSAHSAAVIKLIDRYLIILQKQLDAGWTVNVSDFEKLMNVQYKLLAGGGDNEKNLNVLFQNFADRYDVKTFQPKLFDSDESRTVEKKQD